MKIKDDEYRQPKAKHVLRDFVRFRQKKTTKGKYIGVVLSRSHAVTRNFEIIY